MNRKVIIAGNWKMNKTGSEGRALVGELVDAVAPFDSLVKPLTDYQLLSPDRMVVVDGAGEYPLTPTPTTALGFNTFYIVPGSGVTATLDATLRLDPTLVRNQILAAIAALGTT